MPIFESRDRTSLYYKDWGTGRPVVMCHGWPLNADMWEYQMLHLASHGFRCIAPDRRGFGRSGQPWSGHDYDTFADDLAALMNSLDLKDATLVGFSMGGGEVARYLARHGTSRVAQAVLISAVTPFLLKTPDHPEGVERSKFDDIRAAIVADRPEFFAKFGRNFYGVDLPGAQVSASILDWTLSMAMQASIKGTLDCVGAFSETDFRPDMTAFDLPTLIVHGDADAIVPIGVTAVAAAKAITGAKLEIYEGAPHGLWFTHAARLNADLLGFLRG